MITRGIFVLTSPEAGEQFLHVIPDLRAIGLAEAMLLHPVAAKRGPAEPMADLASWVRHFEAAVPKVELALKRGDAVKWIYELAKVREAEIVVLSGIPNGVTWDFERVSSPLRRLGIPVLFLPRSYSYAPLGERVLLATKSTEGLERFAAEISSWFRGDEINAVRIGGPDEENDDRTVAGVKLTTLATKGDVAGTLMDHASRCRATLLTILARAEEDTRKGQAGSPVVRPIIEGVSCPVLVWPHS